MLLEIRLGKGNRGTALDVGALQLRDEVVDGQRVHFLVLRERGHRVPAKVTDEGDAGRVVGGIWCHGAVEEGKFLAIAQCRRRGTEGHLQWSRHETAKR